MTTVAISSSELRYRRLFEAARDGILIVDPATRKIIDVNPFLVTFLGYSYGELIGKELYEIGLLKDEAASQAAFMELQTIGYIRYDDLPLETKDGRRVDVEFVSNVYQEGDTQVIQCNIRDISARKLADKALRQSEERFKLVSRAVSDVIWDWDLVTDNLWWSDSFLTTFGYAASEIEPSVESWAGRIHPDERGCILNGIHQAIDTGERFWSAEYRFLYKNGSYAFVGDSGYILRNASGQGVRMVGGLRDLTEIKKKEAQHLRAQRMESIGALASGIAHDLNNMLAPIMMSIELLKLDSGDPADRNAVLETIDLSCRRGADLVHQVLAFAQGLEGQRIAIRLRHLFDDLNGIIRETFPRNIKIVSHVPNDLWPVTGDPTQLHQVLLNLSVNARDAMPQGGTLTLSATNSILDAQCFGTDREPHTGRYVLIAVRDTGMGIPEGIRERIFEPFFTTKDIGRGTGFGLATVKTIIKSHGGLLYVDSEVGQGTTFKIYLPAEPALQVATKTPFHLNMPRGRGELVLVVDDEASIREITQRTLESFGYSVITASEGTEAVARYAQQPQAIAVVLTDMMMPILDGPGTIQALRRINPAIKIIVVSGLEIHADIKACVQGLLAKPFTAQSLIQLVREVLDSPALVPA